MPLHDICVPDVLYGNAGNNISDSFDVNNACGPVCRTPNLIDFTDIECVDVLLCCLTAEPNEDCSCIEVTAQVDVVFEVPGVPEPQLIVVQRTLTDEVCVVGPFSPADNPVNSNFGAENIPIEDIITQIDGICLTITNLTCETDMEGLTSIDMDYTLKLWKHNNLIVNAFIPNYAAGVEGFNTITVNNPFNEYGPCLV